MTIPKEYVVNDFGFTAVDDPTAEVPPVVDTQVSEQVRDTLIEVSEALTRIEAKLETHPKLNKEEVDSRLQGVEKLILPLLVNLAKNPEKDYILWPNRGEQVQERIDAILALTRG